MRTRRKKLLLKLLAVVMILVAFWVAIAIIPPKKAIEENPFIAAKGERPMIAAHRGGKNLNPENTMLAFDYAINNCHVDILELDLCLTKDERLVAIHDFTINACSDAEEVLGEKKDYYVADFTLEELREFNFGAKFTDRSGNRSYADLVAPADENRKEIIRAAKLNIVTIEEIFDAYYDTDLLFIIEIKNDGDQGKRAADILHSLLTDNERYPESDLSRRVVIGTFHDEIEQYLRERYPGILRGASVGEAARFILTQMFGVNLFDRSSFVCLQIPVAYDVYGVKLNLVRQTYIRRAHRRNIAVQYWTVNDEDTMRKLIKAGADAIMTDDPDVLCEVLIDMGYDLD